MPPTDAPLVVRRVRRQARIDRMEGVYGALEHFWSAAEDRGAPPDYEDRVQFDLAVIEVAANICRHAGREASVTLDLELTLFPDRAEARFEDDAAPATLPLNREMPPPAAESGRGLAIVQRVVDEMRYERAREHNVWFLRKQFRSL